MKGLEALNINSKVKSNKSVAIWKILKQDGSRHATTDSARELSGFLDKLNQ